MKNLIPKEIKIENNFVIAGISAGPDSMALLNYLNKTFPNKVICVHINHNIRKESQEEEAYLKKYCQKENIIFESTKIKSYKENNFENEARKKRYTFYEKMMKKYKTKYLFLAHHGDDLLETIIMKFIRGSNLKGYSGFNKVTKMKDYLIIRPFVEYEKKQLIEYCNKNNIKYYLDKTNEDITFTRNRIRKNIIPLLKKEDENIIKKALKYSNQITETNNYIQKEIESAIKEIYKNETIDINKLKKKDLFLQKNIIFKILTIAYSNKENTIKEKHLESILKMVKSNKSNIKINLPKQKMAIKEYDKLYIKNIQENEKSYYLKLKKTNNINNHIIKIIDKSNKKGNDIIRLNKDEIKLPLYLRNKNKGDKILIKGAKYHKKIKDIFIEKKIPITKRSNYPILIDSNNQILWIPNLKKSIFDKEKDEKYDIILWYCEKEEFYEK